MSYEPLSGRYPFPEARLAGICSLMWAQLNDKPCTGSTLADPQFHLDPENVIHETIGAAQAAPVVDGLEDRRLLAAPITEFPISTGSPGITAGPDANLWFTLSDDKIGRITRTARSPCSPYFLLSDQAASHPVPMAIFGSRIEAKIKSA